VSSAPRAGLTLAVDVALLSVLECDLLTLLYRNDDGRWALPGVVVDRDETLDAAARRALQTKASLRDVYLEQLFTFGDPRRDPRARVVTVAHYALVDRRRLEARAKGEPDLVVGRIHVPWAGETGGPVEVFSGERLKLAFDHADILGMAVRRIRGKLDWSPIGFQLLPEKFTLYDLQRVHETVLGRPLNKDSFRRRMLASGELEATGEMEREVDHRPAELYRFVKRSAV
jgi:8-oxo-dGTP diphosphatase